MTLALQSALTLYFVVSCLDKQLFKERKRLYNVAAETSTGLIKPVLHREQTHNKAFWLFIPLRMDRGQNKGKEQLQQLRQQVQGPVQGKGLLRSGEAWMDTFC